MNEKSDMVYVRRDRRCGCIYMATVDDPTRPDRREGMIGFICDVLREGDVIERMTRDAYKASGFGGCAVCQPAEQQALPL